MLCLVSLLPHVLEPVLQPNDLCYMALLPGLCSVYSWFAGQCMYNGQNEYPLSHILSSTLYSINYNIMCQIVFDLFSF